MSTETATPTRQSRVGLITVGVFGGLATGILAVAFPFVSPAFRRIVLPYVPATTTQIENVLQALKYRRPHHSNSSRTLPSDLRVIDLGSGDGRIVIECARHGMQSHGVELNPWRAPFVSGNCRFPRYTLLMAILPDRLVLYSKFRAYREGVRKFASFQRKNLFEVDLADYDRIVVFGVDTLMPLIERKVSQDCDRKTKQVTLIVCRFPLPNWQPFASFGSGVDQVWLYQYYPAGVGCGTAKAPSQEPLSRPAAPVRTTL